MSILKPLVERAKKRTAIEMGWLYAGLPASQRTELLADLKRVNLPITFNLDLIAPDMGMGEEVSLTDCLSAVAAKAVQS